MSAITRRRVTGAIILLAALVAVLASSGCRGGVPDVVGMGQADAVRALQEEGYLLGKISIVVTDSVGVGVVTAQDPAAGERAKEGTLVDLAVNAATGEDVIVPSVTGLTEAAAVSSATSAELTPLVTEQYSDMAVEGAVATQSPSPGSTVARGDTLVIVVSKGEAPAKAKVPNVVGKSQADAESAIEKAGFSVAVTKVYYDTVAKGKVIAQQPEADSSVNKGSEVQIVVSLGKGTGSATVPSVKGKSESDASNAISDAGLKTKVVRDYSDSVAKGKVIDQFPASGSKAAAGSEVLISVSLGKEPAGTVAVPDVMGMSEADAVAAVEGAGLVIQVEQLPSDSVAAGSVGYQFPAAGTQVAPGSEVLVAVSTGPEPQ